MLGARLICSSGSELTCHFDETGDLELLIHKPLHGNLFDSRRKNLSDDINEAL